jgi:hypothetical protein
LIFSFRQPLGTKTGSQFSQQLDAGSNPTAICLVLVCDTFIATSRYRERRAQVAAVPEDGEGSQAAGRLRETVFKHFRLELATTSTTTSIDRTSDRKQTAAAAAIFVLLHVTMHFAYPPRKSSNPPPFRPRSARIPTLRKSRLKIIAVAGLAILLLIWLFSPGSSSKPSPMRAISGKPPVVIVTVFDEKTWGGEPEYLKSIKDNREEYAKLHGKNCYRRYPWCTATLTGSNQDMERISCRQVATNSTVRLCRGRK